MAKKKYVPAGVFLTCDKGTVPNTLKVTFNARTSIYGQNLATDLDKVPNVNVPPLGVCTITKAPCQVIPVAWNPVKTDVQLGKARLLLEDSKLQCGLGGRISINFSLAAAQAACPPPPAPPKSVFDQADDYLKSLGPAGDMARFQLGVAEGVWEGGKGLAEGLWGMAKGGWNAVTHPADTAKAIQEGATKAYKWAGDSQNWANAAASAQQGARDAATWASNGENWQKVGQQMQQMSPRDWGKIGGQVAFEVGLTVGTAGAGAALNAAAKTSRVARMAARVARVADVEGLALKAAGKVARTAAGKMKVVGKVLTGAKKAKRTKKAVQAAKAGKKAKKLNAVKDCAGPKKCNRRGHPVDVATGLVFTEAVDFELPGPVPLRWERVWYSRSTHASVLGHGWHHSYDLGLAVEDDGTVALRMADGRLALFQSPIEDKGSYNRTERLELFGNPAQGYRVWNVEERLWYVFEKQVAADEHRLRTIEDTNGFAIRFAYTEQGALCTIIDSAGRLLRAETDQMGRLLAWHAPLPELEATGTFPIVRYEYSTAGDLLAVIDALGHAMRFEYDNHLLVRETNRVGLSFYFTYDGIDHTAHCLRTWGDGGIYDTKLRYDSAEQTSVWDSLGNATVYTHQNGLVTTTVDALGAVWQRSYNVYQELEFERDPLGNASTFEYDARGNLTQVTRPDGAKEHTQYNQQDLPIQVMDANGGTWQWEYDARGNLTKRTDPLGAETHYRYEQGLLMCITGPTGRDTQLAYDNAHQLTHIISADGHIRSQNYDRLGRRVRLIDARGNVQHRRYDWLGQLTAVREPDGSEQHLRYDGEGNIELVQGPKREVRFAYTGLNRLAMREQAGARVQFRYDPEGRLTNLVNENQEVYQFELDATGNVMAEIGFDGLTRRYERDAAGQVTQVYRPGNRWTRYHYDGAGRVLHTLYHDGTEEHFRYRSDGELVEARNQHGTVMLEKDALGRVLVERQNEHMVTSSYDILGHRLSLSSSLGAAVQWQRSGDGAVAEIVAGHWHSKFDYDAFGLEIQRTLSGGVQTSWLRDAQGRPVQQQIIGGPMSRPVSRRRRYQWQHADSLTEIDDTLQGLTRYEHDAWGNLAATYYADGTQELRQPDSVGNLFRTTERRDRRYGAGGQLLEANGIRYRYDTEGNLVQKIMPTQEVWRYDWNGAGQLVKATRPDGYAITFAYDALGRRIRKRFRGKVTHWVWDGDKVLHEWHELEMDSSASSVADVVTWLFEEESFAPQAKLTPQGAYSIICDHLGTPLELYDAQQGTKTWQAQLDSYGQVREGKGKPQDCPFRYQGQYEDVETGLYYNRFRYYDPESGVYLSQDPIGLMGGIRLYNYVHDPVAWVDQYGLAWNPAGPGKPGNPAMPDVLASNNPNLAPDFTGTKHLYNATGSERNIVKIKLQGSRSRDFTEAFKEAKIKKAKAKGYTWHHLDDFDPVTGESTMQLVKADAHRATYTHYGSADQFAKHFGVEYDSQDAIRKADEKGWLKGKKPKPATC